MEKILIITSLGLIFGMIGTTLGGIVGVNIKVISNKFLGFILEFAAGLMTAMICFDLIPESLEIVSIGICIIGIFLGIISMVICDNFISKINKKNSKYNSLLKTGIIIGIGLTIHNFPEGLAIGSGFVVSNQLGLSLAIAIAIHDFPEGISMAVPMSKGGFSKAKVIILTAISGITTGFGALAGAIIGNVSVELIGISLAFAAGTMLYITSCELIPESNKLYKGRFASLGNILGLILGIFVKIL